MLKLLLLSQYLACNESNTEDTSDELKLDLPAEKEEEVVEEIERQHQGQYTQ